MRDNNASPIYCAYGLSNNADSASEDDDSAEKSAEKRNVWGTSSPFLPNDVQKSIDQAKKSDNSAETSFDTEIAKRILAKLDEIDDDDDDEIWTKDSPFAPQRQR